MTETSTTPNFAWFTPTGDDSAPMTWNNFVNLHMRDRDRSVAPTVQLQAISHRWRSRPEELKVKGKHIRSRILPMTTPDMYGDAGGKHKRAETAATEKKPRVKKVKLAEAPAQAEDDLAVSESSVEGGAVDTSAAAVSGPKSRRNPLVSFSRDLMQRKKDDGKSVTRFQVHTTKKNQRILTRCLSEACHDIEENKLTPRQALLRGVTIPFDFLSR